jgi:peptidoglycan hydrolase-like protein with peptidoglycan-binding domain
MELERRAFVKGAAATAAGGALGLLGVVSGVEPALAATSPTLRQGSHGTAVRSLQRRLSYLGYWCGAVDGVFGGMTRSAVIALQKVARIARDGICGPVTWSKVRAGVRPAARTHSGHIIEVHRDRQVLLVVDSGRVRTILAASTGSENPYYSQGRWWSARTTPGRYRVYLQRNRWDSGPLGSLYRPMYFNGGIAVHGYTSVPTYPASHGCVRVSIAAMNLLWLGGRMGIGTGVNVY